VVHTALSAADLKVGTTNAGPANRLPRVTTVKKPETAADP